jgi:hypothetical protein
MLDDAGQAFREALAVAEFIGNPTQLWLTHVALGRLHAERHSPNAAREAYAAARRIIEQTRAGLQNADLRASLDRSALVRQVYEKTAP